MAKVKDAARMTKRFHGWVNERVILARTPRLAILCGALAALSSFATAPSAQAACSNEALRVEQHSTFLPNCRAYELVSPPDKNGGDVIPDSSRTVAAADGSALAFSSLAGFGDARGMGIAGDYVAERSSSLDPGDSGWATHAITPLQDPENALAASRPIEAQYLSLSPDLAGGVFQAISPLTDDPYVKEVANLYTTRDLRSSSIGFSLATACPLCESNTPLPPYPLPKSGEIAAIPYFSAVSSDYGSVLFSSNEKLTQASNADSHLTSQTFNLYLSDHGTTKLVGLVPPSGTECADPNCTPPPHGSVAGQGPPEAPSNNRYTPHVLSSDGSRVIFTANPNHGCSIQAHGTSVGGACGGLYERDLSSSPARTVQLNAPERTAAGPASGGAVYDDASADGSRVFFETEAQLIDTDHSGSDIYMWDEHQRTEVQELSVEAGDGAFTLSYEGEATSTLPYDASATEIEAALDALPAIGGNGGSVSVAGSGPFTVTFQGDLAEKNVPEISIDATHLSTAVGRELTCAGGPAQEGVSLAYQWLRNGAPTPGATASTYTTTGEDEGAVVQCQVTATDSAAGSTQVADATASQLPVVVAPFPAQAPPKAPPSIASPLPASPSAGTQETCAPGSWSGSPSFTYQWYVSGVPVSGATEVTYTLQPADVPGAIQCVVSGTNVGGTVTEASAIRTTSGTIPPPGVPSATASVGPEPFASTEVRHGGHLTRLSVQDPSQTQPVDASYVLGVSEDGRSVYFAAKGGQLVAGQPAPPAGKEGVYLWRDRSAGAGEGELRYVGAVAEDDLRKDATAGPQFEPEARVSPDGRFLLFVSSNGAGLLSVHGGTDYDQGHCANGAIPGCFELYLYDSEAESLRCVSCSSLGAVPTHSATVDVAADNGAAKSTSALNHPLSSDGRYVFFSTPEPLVEGDTNGVSDAYEYDTETGEVHLLSSGTEEAPSYFLDASANGRNAFIATRQRLLGWDTDGAYDIYDVRVDGGFPEPTPEPAPCNGEGSCRPPVTPPPPLPSAASASFARPGNPPSHRPNRKHRKHRRKPHHRHTKGRHHHG